MNDVERVNVNEPGITGDEAQSPAESARSTAFTSGPQPLRPSAPLRTVTRTPPPIRRPEQEPHPRFGRTMKAIRTVLPILQRALPLLEGNVASALANLLAPLPQGSPASLEPVERALRGVQAEMEQLRCTHKEQATVLQRLDEQVADLKDATDRQSSQQQELSDELHSLRRRLTLVAVVGLLLLTVSLGTSIFLFFNAGLLRR
ncbi:MAG: hypothetical protein P4L40_16365 [Terracidiphilus sp.]|nr:hypothetical protein [Terracidiphilus sp.]